MQRVPLPRNTPPAFTVEDARALGISEGRIRAHDLTSPFHGTRARRALTDAERVRLLMRALPDHAFLCGLSAARLLNLPLPMSDERKAFDPICIGVPSDRTRIRRPSVHGFRFGIERGDLFRHSGILTLTPERLWVELSRTQQLGRLTAVTDHMLHGHHPLSSYEALAHTAERFAGRPGSAKRQRTLELADARAESPAESLLRVLLIEAGLPRPECNVEIFDGGRFVARVDMLFRDKKLVVEYDGDYHRDPDQWSRDQSRRAELESLGYRVTNVTRRDFDNPAQLVARIRRLLANDS